METNPGYASKAVDGILSHRHTSVTRCAHTASYNVIWEVDLEHQVRVHQVIIYNRDIRCKLFRVLYT